MKTKLELITEFLESINHVDHLDLPYFASENLESYDDLYQAIEDGNGFDVEIIYYSNAMEYLTEHDTSLTESLELAHEFGYTCDNVNSELLASILATQNVRNDFSELEDEITDFFDELEDTYLSQFEVSEELAQEIEKTAKSMEYAGASCKVDWLRSTIAVITDTGEEYFFQGQEADEMIEKVPPNVNEENYFLWSSRNW